VLELEPRDVPAWYNITAPSPAAGAVGVTDAAHAGGLTFNPAYAAVDGVVTVWADSVEAAVAEAIRGTITVTVGGQSVDQVFGPATVGAAADHKAFAVGVSGTAASVALEDLVGFAGVTPDYDYNDRTWGGVTVVPVGPPVVMEWETMSGPGGVIDGWDQVRFRQRVTRYNETELGVTQLMHDRIASGWFSRFSRH